MKSYQVIFQPGNLKTEVYEGSTIMEAMDGAGIDYDFPCGGNGKCGKCRVKILSEAALPTDVEKELLAEKELLDGIRLACETTILGNMSVGLLNYGQQHNVLIASGERSFQVEPHLRKIFMEVKKPSLDAQRSDWSRLKDQLLEHGCGDDDPDVPLPLLRRLPEALRQAGHSLTTVIYGGRVVDIEERDTTGSMLGMAFDIGTTTIVGYLLDLYSGRELGVASMLNPQTKFGADVITRIQFASMEQDGLDKLHTAVVEAINKLIREATEKAGVGREQIYVLTVAANSCMHHLFLGLPPRNIAISPYVPVVGDPLTVDAAALGIDINPAGKVLTLPNIAGFVGADTTAVLLATEIDRSEDIKLVIDIGTNGEIALGSKDRIVACSAAAGPAFEGAQISSGMRGAEGAIDHVRFGERLEYSVIGGVKPLGICGSALLDAVAGLLELGIIEPRGRFAPPDTLTNTAAIAFKDRLIEHGGQKAFLLADADQTGNGRPIMITQGDIRELQLAKGAMAAGVSVLMETCGIRVEDIKEVLLAGAFGNYMHPHSACVIGLIPPALEGKIKMVGNAAGTGAKLALLSASEYRRAAAIANAVGFVELGSYPKFNSIFAKTTYFHLT